MAITDKNGEKYLSPQQIYGYNTTYRTIMRWLKKNAIMKPIRQHRRLYYHEFDIKEFEEVYTDYQRRNEAFDEVFSQPRTAKDAFLKYCKQGVDASKSTFLRRVSYNVATGKLKRLEDCTPKKYVLKEVHP